MPAPSVPRVRGDDPVGGGEHGFDFTAFPACAGTIRTTRPALSPTGCVPREGFQPTWISAEAVAAASPLNERFEAFLRDEREVLLKFLLTRLPTDDAQKPDPDYPLSRQ